MELLFKEGKPKDKWILITGESMSNRIVIVPDHVSSLQEEDY